MANKRKQLEELIQKGEELGLIAPSDVTRALSLEDARKALDALKVTINIRDLPIFSHKDPGLVPPFPKEGLVLTSGPNGFWQWKNFQHITYGGGAGGDVLDSGIVVGQLVQGVTDSKHVIAAAIIPPAINILTLTNAAVSTLALVITAGKTLTLTAADNYNLTVPATGTAALLNQANSFTLINPLTTIAESWIGPSSTAGIYFKSGNVGVGTTLPGGSLDIHNDSNKIGFQVQGFSTQTNNLAEFLNSSATILTHVNPDGTLDIGIATGTAPLVIASTTKVTNLNADMFDGLHSTDIPNIKQTISLLAQTAAIGTTAITETNTAGLYRVSYSLLDTTADLTAGTIMVNFTGTDEAGAFTMSSIALPLTALGRTQGTFFLRISGTGSVSYNTALVGVIGTSQYALFISVEKIL